MAIYLLVVSGLLFLSQELHDGVLKVSQEIHGVVL